MKITEQLEFMTQIHKSWNNTEQRAALRFYPRRNVTYEYLGVENEESQYLRALIYAQQNSKILVPLWHASYKIPEILYKHSYDLKIPTNRIWQFRGAQNVLLFVDDKVGGYQNKITSFYANGAIKVKNPLSSEYAPGSILLLPYVSCVLSQQDKFVNITSLNSSMEIDYELMQDYTTIPIPASFDEFHYEQCQDWDKYINNLIPTYNNLELFMAQPTWTEDMSVDYQRNSNRLDNRYGAFRFDIKSNNPIEHKDMSYITGSREELNNFQRFFCRCKGMLKAFYAPTWLSDLELVDDAPAGQSFLITKFPYYWKYYSIGQRRKTLVLFTRGGKTIIVEAGAYTIDETGEYGKVLLEAPLKQSLLKDDIVMISYLVKYRFNSDIMLTSYESGESASFTLPVMEVDV